ncbi:hypothetical protein COP2_009168 [Malus domestica]
MMAYGSPADSMNETHGMSESTCLDTLKQFCDTIVQVYKDEYLREPNQEDLNRLIRKAKDLLGRSPLFNNLTKGKTHQLDYYINNRQYNMRYYLADDIYQKWATLVQAIPNPRNDAEKLFTLYQEAYRKDVERAFGILQARWKIINEPAIGWS